MAIKFSSYSLAHFSLLPSPGKLGYFQIRQCSGTPCLQAFAQAASSASAPILPPVPASHPLLSNTFNTVENSAQMSLSLWRFFLICPHKHAHHLFFKTTIISCMYLIVSLISCHSPLADSVFLESRDCLFISLFWEPSKETDVNQELCEHWSSEWMDE